jgi:phage terminase large subunit-like protein
VIAEPTPEEFKEFTDALGVIEYAETYERFRSFEPYPKQKVFLALGLTKRERLLTAGNQQGKTETGAFEVACHLTGEYPRWWKGRVWNRPTKGWIAGETSLAVRDTQQKKLCGEPGVERAFGTGMIPLEAFADRPSLARGVTDAYDTIQVRHKSGGISIGRFKSYEQGRAKFQGDTLDWVWNDEECPIEIYSEELARITATNGMIFTTFTSMKGTTALTNRFHLEESQDRDMVKMGIADALHIPIADHAKIIAGYLPYEREARVHGGIIRGHGRVFELSDEIIAEPPLSYIPVHWAKLWSVDFGIGHPFAAVLSLWDKDNDVIHIHHCLRIADQIPIQHAFAMKQIGAGVPVAWPHDGASREKTSGETLAAAYKKHGLLMSSGHATWPDGGISTEAGILEMVERMRTGRFKVAAHLSEWFEEYRDYHRKDGQIVKIRDDLMSATRVGVMAKRYARAVQIGSKAAERSIGGVADGTSFDVFA